jgi:alpha-ketoglutarate-dependent taurine dioxygenase
MRRPTLNELRAGQRKAISSEQMVAADCLQSGATLPLLVRPVSPGLNLAVWAAHNRGWIEQRLDQHGAILFRDFLIDDVGEFEWFVNSVSAVMLEYQERSSPRSRVSGRIYTSTEYAASQSIFLHNENSYQLNWPTRIFFYCAQPAAQGGETPIADTRRVYQRLSPETRERFARKQIRYVRNFGAEFGLRWPFVFQTTDKEVVEQYCRRNEIKWEWREGNRLRTESVRPGILRHPRTGEWSWFNHAAFFHVSTLEPTMRNALLSELDADDLPNNTYYGDGTEIEPEVLDEIRSAYGEERVCFPWQKGDVLMVDNLLVAHSRMPYTGARKVVVAMADPLNWKDALAARVDGSASGGCLS